MKSPRTTLERRMLQLERIRRGLIAGPSAGHHLRRARAEIDPELVALKKRLREIEATVVRDQRRGLRGGS